MLGESHAAACLPIDSYLAVVLEVVDHTSPDDRSRLHSVEGDKDTPLLDIQQMSADGAVAAGTGEACIVVCPADFVHD